MIKLPQLNHSVLLIIYIRRYITIGYLQLRREQTFLAQKIQSLQHLLTTFPKGTLLCSKNGNYVKWYISNGSSPIYLPKKNHTLAKSLAVRKYYEFQLHEYLQQKQAIDCCLNKLEQISDASSVFFNDDSLYKPLITSYFQEFPTQLQHWISQDYEHSTSHPEHLIHKCLSGHNVRSKSEVIIANALFLNQIPYRYECLLSINDIDFFPDFTIYHPVTHKLFYWEHFGMMDIESYSSHAFNKLKIYAQNGIIPTINLITTYETQKNPIDSEQIEALIQHYFF